MRPGKNDAATKVARCVDSGWTPVLDGHGAFAWFNFDHRRGTYKQLVVFAGDRRIEVTVSPKGLSTQVYVDGKQVKK